MLARLLRIIRTHLSGVTAVVATAVEVAEEPTREELAEAMSHVNHCAKRAQCIIGTPEHPSIWDRRHEALNAMLTDWQARG